MSLESCSLRSVLPARRHTSYPVRSRVTESPFSSYWVWSSILAPFVVRKRPARLLARAAQAVVLGAFFRRHVRCEGHHQLTRELVRVVCHRGFGLRHRRVLVGCSPNSRSSRRGVAILRPPFPMTVVNWLLNKRLKLPSPCKPYRRAVPCGGGAREAVPLAVSGLAA